MSGWDFGNPRDKMETEYYLMFEEIKKLIERLTILRSAANPQQAQLNNFKNVWDILKNKKTRITMKKLLKCRQVLTNLCAKIEQHAHRNNESDKSSENDKPEFTAARRKLKSVVSRLTDYDIPETISEIAKKTKKKCKRRSKEPALFPKRTNKQTTSVKSSNLLPSSEETFQSSKRNYTRVLRTPERNGSHWSSNEHELDKPLFIHKSPRTSRERYTPSYNKKEIKKSNANPNAISINESDISLASKTKVIEELNNINISDASSQCNIDKDVPLLSTSDKVEPVSINVASNLTNENGIEIPLLDYEESLKKDASFEIDTLQALREEIMRETSTALSTDAESPSLHQAQISKVNSQDMSNMKKISIEKYKTISINPSKSISNSEYTSNDDLCRKQSLKLTEKKNNSTELKNSIPVLNIAPSNPALSNPSYLIQPNLNNSFTSQSFNETNITLTDPRMKRTLNQHLGNTGPMLCYDNLHPIVNSDLGEQNPTVNMASYMSFFQPKPPPSLDNFSAILRPSITPVVAPPMTLTVPSMSFSIPQNMAYYSTEMTPSRLSEGNDCYSYAQNYDYYFKQPGSDAYQRSNRNYAYMHPERLLTSRYIKKDHKFTRNHSYGDYYHRNFNSKWYREQNNPINARNGNIVGIGGNSIESTQYGEPRLGRVNDRDNENNLFHSKRGNYDYKTNIRNQNNSKKFRAKPCGGFSDSRYDSEKSKLSLKGPFTETRSNIDDVDSNNFTVHSNSGIKIDTSIDKRFEMSHSKENFNARRRRAASVERICDCDKSDNSIQMHSKLIINGNHDRNKLNELKKIGVVCSNENISKGNKNDIILNTKIHDKIVIDINKSLSTSPDNEKIADTDGDKNESNEIQSTNKHMVRSAKYINNIDLKNSNSSDLKKPITTEKSFVTETAKIGCVKQNNNINKYTNSAKKALSSKTEIIINQKDYHINEKQLINDAVVSISRCEIEEKEKLTLNSQKNLTFNTTDSDSTFNINGQNITHITTESLHSNNKMPEKVSEIVPYDEKRRVNNNSRGFNRSLEQNHSIKEKEKHALHEKVALCSGVKVNHKKDYNTETKANILPNKLNNVNDKKNTINTSYVRNDIKNVNYQSTNISKESELSSEKKTLEFKSENYRKHYSNSPKEHLPLTFTFKREKSKNGKTKYSMKHKLHTKNASNTSQTNKKNNNEAKAKTDSVNERNTSEIKNKSGSNSEKEFPVIGKRLLNNEFEADKDLETPKQLVCDRHLSKLISTTNDTQQYEQNNTLTPQREREGIISQGTTDQSLPSLYHPMLENKEKGKEDNYEEAQTDVISKKHHEVVQDMMTHENLAQNFECAGGTGTDNPCKFSTHSPEISCEDLHHCHGTAAQYTCFGGTTKDVLRLVHLNQPNVVVRDISTNKCKKKSVREAERSIELEKLIGNATSMNESNLSSSNFTGVTGKLNTSEEILPESLTPPVEIPKHPVSNLQVSEMSLSNLDVPVYSSSSIQVQNPSSSTVKPVIQIEQNTPKKVLEETSRIYCLDNDEDNVIDLTKDIDTLPDTSEDLEPGDENKKLPPFLLYKCSECELCMKTASEFSSHVKDCINIEDYVLCAHCPSIIDRDHLIPHYLMTHLKSHVDKNMCLKCPICTYKIYSSYEAAEKHFVIDHSLTRSQVTWKEQLLSDGGVSKSECIPITVVDNQEVTEERKRSAGSKDKAIEPLKKKKKTCGRRDMIKLHINSTLDDCLYCALCEFSTKLKKDMERHLQVHAEQQRVPAHCVPTIIASVKY